MKEISQIDNIPKLKTPEEEIIFLKKEIEKREKALEGITVPELKKIKEEEITKEVLKTYKELPTEQLIPQERTIPSSEIQKITLRLTPETHDKKMEELMAIVYQKGLKNALNIVKNLNNPHVEDDFHRFLVEYLRTFQAIPGLKDPSPLSKALKMVLFEVILPEFQGGEKESQKGFKEFLGAMEQFYAGMLSIAQKPDNYDKDYYTIEIAQTIKDENVVVYVAVPTSKIELFEKQILAFYPKARIKEMYDDYNIFNEKGFSCASLASLMKEKVFPIKTYDKLEADPLVAILNVFSKLKKEGEGAAIQFIITPMGEKLVKEFSYVLKEVEKGRKLKEVLESGWKSFGKATLKILKEIVVGYEEKKEEEKKAETKDVEKINEKLKSSIMNVIIRLVSSAETKQRAEEILSQLEASFNQFTEPTSNGLKFERIKENNLQETFYNFSFRLPLEKENIPLNLKEMATLFHFPISVSSIPYLKQARAPEFPAPLDLPQEGGIILGYNEFQGLIRPIRMLSEDRLRHIYVIGQTGTGKTTILKNMIIQDILNGDGCCFIDPHGSDIQHILACIPKERFDDVIYFDPAYLARPMGLNMLEFKDINQKTFVVNELFNIFKQLYGSVPESVGPAFEQYFRNSAMLVMAHPESGCTLLEIARVLIDEEFREMKLSHVTDPVLAQFWRGAKQVTGEAALANWVPHITNKFDTFLMNDIMRPIVLQEKSVFDFRKIMDERKILLVNLQKGILGELNANLLGLIIVGKIQMAALSRVEAYGQKLPNFYLYIDEFQNVTTDSITSILSEARKYGLSLTIAHQYIAQLKENIKNAVFGNVGTTIVYRVDPADAEVLAKKFTPTITPQDIVKLDNFYSYISLLSRNVPQKPFSLFSHWSHAPRGNPDIVPKLKELSYLKYGRERSEVEEEIREKYETYASLS